MPHNGLDFRHRAQLTERMDEPCSRDVMRPYLRDLARVNRWFLAYRPILKWFDSIRPLPSPVRILDVGCGYGDTLRRVESWAGERGVQVELTGLDVNPESIAIAREASPADSRIEWLAGDVFKCSLSRPAHLVISSLFTHHLADRDVVLFLEWMERNADLGWFVNDLSRASTPYYLFRWFARAVGLHPFVQHDGPVSIARAFVPEDWRRLCAAAGLKPDEIEIQSYKPARLCVSRRKLS